MVYNINTGSGFYDPDTVDGGGGVVVDPDAPTVISTTPAEFETNLISDNITATFSEEMNPATIESPAVTFTIVKRDGAVDVPGVVSYSGNVATFNPDTDLVLNTVYTAKITTSVQDTAGNALAVDKTWDFIVGPANPAIVPLLSSGNYVIFSESLIAAADSTVQITGDLGMSPNDSTAITGFNLVLDASLDFSRPTPLSMVTGKIFASDYSASTQALLTTARTDRTGAYNNAAGRPVDYTDLGAGLIGGMTLSRGVYAWGSIVNMASDVYLSGSATDVWIFKTTIGINMSSGVRIHLLGGALPQNIFWQSAGNVTLDSTSHLEGVVLGATQITLISGSSVNGRLLAFTDITLGATTVVVEP
ncbi:MAG: hypothetical protein CVV49_16465 [Spirochaetae bacterium HGW-Spirochaetae-5]|nr:MAG: hypothetical protein CVV49_16465 [Spirochaetae bacterium HGW-Spirochaetae-5]